MVTNAHYNGQLNTDNLYRKLINKIKEDPTNFNRVVFNVLTILTSNHGLGYNRAVCIMKNGDPNSLEGFMGKGPVGLGEIEIKNSWERGYATLDEEFAHYPYYRKNEDPIQLVMKKLKLPLQPYFKDVKPKGHDIHFIDSQFFPNLYKEAGFETNGKVGVIHLLSSSDLVGIVTLENFPPFKPEIDHEELRTVADFTDLIALTYSMNVSTKDIYRPLSHQIAHDLRNPIMPAGAFMVRTGRLLDKLYEKLEPYLLDGKDIEFDKIEDVIRLILESRRNISLSQEEYKRLENRMSYLITLLNQGLLVEDYCFEHKESN